MRYLIHYIYQDEIHVFDECKTRREAGMGVALLRSKGFNAWYVIKEG